MRFSAAILSGVATAVLAAFPLAWVGGGLHPGSAWAALLLGVMVMVLVCRVTPPSSAPQPRSFLDYFMVVVFCCASARAFFWLIYEDENFWKILSPNNLGDISLHLSLIRWLAVAPHWWPASPILVGDSLRYPLGSDLFNALLLQAGLPVERGLIWCGIVGAILTGVTLWRWGGAIALAALLFNGGFFGVMIFSGGDPDAVAQWKNLFLTLFVTQRGFLFALPAGLLLLAAWREETFAPEKREVLPLSVQALLLGVTPLFSVHAALFFGVAMTGLFLIAPASRERMIRLALVAWPAMALLGWLVVSGGGGPPALSAIGWSPGWMSHGTLSFWFCNFGIALPLALFLCLALIRKNSSLEPLQILEARAFVWPAAFLFATCLLIRFAPWPWDNTKLMLWSWIVIIPYLWSLLIEPNSLPIRLLTLLLLFGSGAASLLIGLDGRHGYELIQRSALDEAAWTIRGVSPGEVIACAPEYNHPVLLLGHPVVCGYEGHLWSHGLDFKERLASLNAMMNGEAGWQEMARKLGVSYIYWSPLERNRWPDSKLPWASESATPSLHLVK